MTLNRYNLSHNNDNYRLLNAFFLSIVPVTFVCYVLTDSRYCETIKFDWLIWLIFFIFSILTFVYHKKTITKSASLILTSRRILITFAFLIDRQPPSLVACSSRYANFGRKVHLEGCGFLRRPAHLHGYDNLFLRHPSRCAHPLLGRRNRWGGKKVYVLSYRSKLTLPRGLETFTSLLLVSFHEEKTKG